MLLGVCLLVGGCGNSDSENNDKGKESSKARTNVEKKKEASKKTVKNVSLPLSLEADDTGKLPEENGQYKTFLTITVPETYGCLTYNTIFSKTNDSGETIANTYTGQGSPNVKEWMQEDEAERYSGMPYAYVLCLDKNKRSSWFAYTLINTDNLKKMEEQYPNGNFELYTPLNTEKKRIEMAMESKDVDYKTLKEDKGNGKAAEFEYTYDYLMAQDDEKARSIYCDYEFDLGNSTILYYSIKAFESEMEISNFDPKEHGKEIAESIKLEQHT